MTKKSFLVSFVAANLIAGSSMVAAAEKYNWSGSYAGVNIGYAWKSNSTVLDMIYPGNYGATDYDTPFVGVMFGHNFRFERNFLAGVETDIQVANGETSVSNPTLGGFANLATANVAMHGFGTVRARVGYDFDGTLFYLTGGYAVAKVEHHATRSAGISYDFEGLRHGATIGAGVERAITDMWRWRVEYSYFDFGSKALVGVGGLGSSFAYFNLNYHTVRFGLTYRFNAH